MTGKSLTEKRALLRELLKNKKTPSIEDLPPISSVLPSEILPVSVQEEWLLNLLQKNPSNPAYTIFHAFEIKAGLKQQAFHHALEVLIQQEPCLRSFFKTNNSSFERVIMLDADCQPNIVYLEDGKNDDNVIRQYLQQLRITSFDVHKSPLFSILVLVIDSSSWIFAITMNHLIADGIAIKLLCERLFKLYWNNANNIPYPEVKLVEPVYANYAIWQRKLLANGSLNLQENFWKNEVKQWYEPSLHYQQNIVGICNSEVESQRFTIDSLVTIKIKQECKITGFTLFTYLLAAWQLTFMRFFPDNKLSVKIMSANRHYHTTQNMIGFLANGLLFCQQYPSFYSHVDILNATHHKLNQIYLNQDYPFELLSTLKENYPHKSCKMVLNWHNYSAHHFKNISFRSDLIESNYLWDDGTEIAFNLFATSEECLNGIVRYRSQLFDSHTIKTFIEQFLNHLSQLGNSRAC